MQNGQRPGPAEARLAGRAWIHEQHAVYALAERFVGMAEDDHLRGRLADPLLQPVVEPARIDDVMQQKNAVGHRDDLGITTGEAVVGVAADRGDRSEGFQLHDEAGRADIPGMHYVLDPREVEGHGRVQKAVGVRDEADAWQGRGRRRVQALAFSGSGASGSASSSPSDSSSEAGASLASRLALSFMAPANKPVNKPPLSSVFRKNSHVCG